MKVVTGFVVGVIFMALVLYLSQGIKGRPLLTDSDIRSIERRVCYKAWADDLDASLELDAQLAREGRNIHEFARETFERTGMHLKGFDLAKCLAEIEEGE